MVIPESYWQHETNDDSERNRVTEKHSDLLPATENRYAGYTVYDDAGERIGKVGALFADENGDHEYLGVESGSLGLRTTLIAVDTARVNVRRRSVQVPGSKEKVKYTSVLDHNKNTPESSQQVRSLSGVASNDVMEIPFDWVVPLLLVCLRQRDRYGHELTRKMMNMGLTPTHPDAVYRALRQMEEGSMIFSGSDRLYSELSQRRYAITESGEAYLEYLASELARYRKEMGLFLRKYDEQHRPGR